MSYQIFSDSSSNLNDKMIDELDVNIVSLTFLVDGEEHESYIKGRDNNLQKFYKMLRDGKVITTSCVNEATFYDAFKPVLEKGEDVLYIGFSSALSRTVISGKEAAERLRIEFPDRKIYVADTLGASLGEGLLLYYAATMRKSGHGIDEVRDFVEQTKLHLCHWFTVDDLVYLYRGGRVKKGSYLIANFAKIKPVMHMDNEGRLTPVSKVLGRRHSLMTLADKLVETAVDPENQMIFISHGDCIEDVEFLKERILSKTKVKGFEVNYVDPVVGAHSGPGTVALFFIGTER